jgi:hypothetical protein
VTLAGCGPLGDDEPSAEQELAAAGDVICAEARTEIAELQKDPPRTAAQQARFTEDLLAVFERELAGLRELDPPPEDEAALGRYLRSRERAIGYVEDGLAAAKAGNAVAYADAQARVAKEQVERTRLAQASGLTECSRPLTAAGNVSP